jgi:hypothetical protein
MEKQIIEVCVFTKVSYKEPVKFGEITIAVEPEDVIHQVYVEPFNGSVEGWEGHYELNVHRKREETDAEYEKRRIENERFVVDSKKKRYENYLKLKKEFENENQ